MMVGRLLSYWEGDFSGAMLNFGRVPVWRLACMYTNAWYEIMKAKQPDLCLYIVHHSLQRGHVISYCTTTSWGPKTITITSRTTVLTVCLQLKGTQCGCQSPILHGKKIFVPSHFQLFIFGHFFHLKKMSLWNTPNTWTFAHVWETLENGAITTWGSSWNPKIGGHKLPFPQLVSCLSGFQWNQQYQTQTHPWKLTCSFENLHVQFRKYIYISSFMCGFSSQPSGVGVKIPNPAPEVTWVSVPWWASHIPAYPWATCATGWLENLWLDGFPWMRVEFKKGAFLGGFIYYGI